MNHLSLFSGIGGLDLAAEWAGFTTVAFVERDPYCQRVLAARWPRVPCFADVRAVVADSNGAGGDQQPRLSMQQWAGLSDADGSGGRSAGEGWGVVVDVVSGGFPCQPHSVAGKRKASADDRDLWPEFARVIREIRPRWVVAENVPGLLHSESGRFFGAVLGDLADMGYSAGWGVWGAADVGALHRRDRVFIVAYAGYDDGSARGPRREQQPGASIGAEPRCVRSTLAHADLAGSQGRLRGRVQERSDERAPGARGASVSDAARELPHGRWIGTAETGWRELADGRGWIAEPDVGRVAHGVPSRVDRLRALGNAVVPQQAYPLFAAIAEIERTVNIERD